MKKNVSCVIIIAMLFISIYGENQAIQSTDEKEAIADVMNDHSYKRKSFAWTSAGCLVSMIPTSIFSCLNPLYGIAAAVITTGIMCYAGYSGPYKTPEDKLKGKSDKYKKTYHDIYQREIKHYYSIQGLIGGILGGIAGILINYLIRYILTELSDNSLPDSEI